MIFSFLNVTTTGACRPQRINQPGPALFRELPKQAAGGGTAVAHNLLMHHG